MWTIKTDTYKERKVLDDFFEILAYDKSEKTGEEFVVAVEGKHYPVTGIMYHPETQNRHVVAVPDETGRIWGPDELLKGKVNNSVTDEINYYFSEHVRQMGLRSMDTHKFEDPEFGERMEWLNSNIGFTRAGATSFTVSNGLESHMSYDSLGNMKEESASMTGG